MPSGKNYQLMVKKLKKQLTASRRKEKATRTKLKTTIAKMKKMGKSHERKLGHHKKAAKAQVAASETSIYMQLANLLRGKAKSRKVTKKTKTVKKTKMPKKVKNAKKSRRL